MQTDDPRLGDHMRPGRDGDVVLLGYPFDIGVQINKGRPGAAKGPSEARVHMKRLGTLVNREYDVDIGTISVTDGGDISTDLSQDDSYRALSDAVREVIMNGGVPFVVGGGNDQSYANGRGAMECPVVAEAGLSIINIDAHLDVRPLVEGRAHSGSPFRMLLEDTRLRPRAFTEFAAQGFQCASAHVDYVRQQGGTIVWLREVQARGAVAAFEAELAALAAHSLVFVSFDLDSVSGADAPGVSAVSMRGLSGDEACAIAFAAGRHPRVVLMDLSEYNPVVESHRTGRLVAAMFYHFCMGVAVRRRTTARRPAPV